MNKKHFKKLSIMLLLLFVMNQIPCRFHAIADSGSITISSSEDFIAFSKKCTLDSWSVGKTVNLICDIDMGNTEFSPVPTFGGTFNGNGYTISGISLTKNGSNTGVFRYIQNGGTVNNLHIKGAITPGGSKSFVGGIAGNNAGTIEKCSFDGLLKGENVIGGIAGKNRESGRIIACTASGNISGENSTGGITGENAGLILSSENHAEINTVYEEKKKDISDLDTDAGAIVETYKTEKEENEEESILGHTDTGGIAGRTYGIVQGCTNYAAIGYQHIGYNVGGIAGRQSGYLLGCDNHGFVQGRKDVGGIVGQVEPYILLSATESSLKNLRQELNNLNTMIDRLITDADNLGDDTQEHLSKISDHSKDARNHTETLLNQGTDFIDDNLGEINAQTAIISNTVSKLEPVFSSLENSAEDVNAALDKISSALDTIHVYMPDLDEEIKAITSAIDEMSNAEDSMNRAMSRARIAMRSLNSALEMQDQAEVKKALRNLSSAISDIKSAKQASRDALDKIESVLKTPPAGLKDIVGNAEEIVKNIQSIKSNLEKSISAMTVISDSLLTVTENTDVDFSAFQTASRHMELAMDSLSSAMHYITTGLKDIGTAVDNANRKLTDYTDDVSLQINTAKEQLSDAFQLLSYAVDDIKTATGDLKQLISDLSKEDSLTFVKLGDDFKNTSENLFDSLSGISEEMNALKDTLSGGKDNITNDLRAISNQFHVVMNLIVGEIEQFQSNDFDTSDLFIDVSDEDIESSKQGKISQCQNFGNVQSDRSTGGIAGAVSIEYAKDPEDDFEKPTTLNFTYNTKAILDRCINEGEITGKKDCTGGIAGLLKLGTIYKCENYGNIKSTAGNYVGGVAGKSDAHIRKSYSKCRVEGKCYNGGIAGKANTLTSCYAIVNTAGEEASGAVIGTCDSTDRISGNYFIDSGTGAIDGISYAGKAEPITYDALKNISFIPRRFISFTVTFLADDATVETQEIKYGDDTAKIKMPKIPEKEGFFGTWHEIESETVTENIEVICEYKPYITILPSAEKSENGALSLALAEGEFTDKAELHITESNKTPPEKTFGNMKVFDISLANTDITENEPVTLRLLSGKREKITAWRMTGGGWEQTSAKKRGKYVILNVTGANSTVCLKYEKAAFNVLYLIPILLVLGIAAILILRKKRKK